MTGEVAPDLVRQAEDLAQEREVLLLERASLLRRIAHGDRVIAGRNRKIARLHRRLIEEIRQLHRDLRRAVLKDCEGRWDLEARDDVEVELGLVPLMWDTRHAPFLAELLAFSSNHGGRSGVDLFLESPAAANLPPLTSALLAAEGRSWLSFWRAETIPAGGSNGPTVLVDALTGERREVVDRVSTFVRMTGSFMLARVIDVEGMSLIAEQAGGAVVVPRIDEIDRDVREALGISDSTPLTPEHLSRPGIPGLLVARWWRALMEQTQAVMGIALTNTDGEKFEFVRTRFALNGDVHDALFDRLAGILDASVVRNRADKHGFLTFRVPGNRAHPDWDNTIVADAQVLPRRLIVDTNSRERAGRVRAEILGVCGDLLTAMDVRTYPAPLPYGTALAVRRAQHPAGNEPAYLQSVTDLMSGTEIWNSLDD